ncbi:MAG: hypothetical protein AAB355_03505 [Patescibacteria group bacterium]
MAPQIKFSSPAKRKRKIAYAKKAAWFLAFMLAVSGGSLFLLRNENLLVDEVKISGNSSISSLEIQTLIEDNLLGDYFRILPKKSIFFYPRRGIEKSIKEKFPGVSQAAASWESLSSPRALGIHVSERSPAYIWCGNLPAEENGGCFFTDNTGVVYDSVPEKEKSKFVVLYGSLSGNVAKGAFLSEDDFLQLSSFIISASENGLLPVSLIKKIDGDAELLLAPGGKIIFSLSEIAGDSDFAISNLESALESQSLKSAIKKNPEKLLYVDLRFGNKVFFKFK